MLCTKFDELKEQNVKFERRFDNNDDCLRKMSSDINKHFDTEFNDKKQQNVKLEDNINKRLNAIGERFSAWEKQIQDNVNNIRKRNEKWKQDTGKCHGNKIKLNEIIDDKVSDDSENISDNHNGE